MEKTIDILFVNVNNTLGVRGTLRDAASWAWAAGSHPAPSADFVVAVYHGEVQRLEFKVVDDPVRERRHWFDLDPTSTLSDLVGREGLQDLCGRMQDAIKLVRHSITTAAISRSAAAL
jgi:hypothetical protein